MRVLHVITALAVVSMLFGIPDARAGEGFTSFGPKEAERKYESAVKQARQTYLAELRRALSSMPATQIDEANRVNAAIKRLEAEIAGRPAEQGTEPQSMNDTTRILIGKWIVTGNDGHPEAWTFQKDGTVIQAGQTGTWVLKEDRILITWNSGWWNAFILPLDRKSTVVDSAKEQKAAIATKIGK